MKRLSLGLGIAVLFLVITAGAALANHGLGSGSAACNADGTIIYTFTVASSGSTVGDVTTRLGDGPTPFTASETLPGTQTTDSLPWHVTFHEDNGNVIHSHGTIVVNFEGTCMASPSPTPSPSSTTPPPTSPPPTSPPPTHGSTPPPTLTHVKGAGGTLGQGGTALTGSNATPAAVVAVTLLIVGLGLMWMARRRAAR